MVCGNPANHTQRLVPSGERVLVGAQGVYEARCRRCFDPLLAGPPERPQAANSERPTANSRKIRT
jgi:thymidine kinase